MRKTVLEEIAIRTSLRLRVPALVPALLAALHVLHQRGRGYAAAWAVSWALEHGEADLTRPFLDLLESLGLHTVLDTRQHTSRHKRPDILAYVDRTDADLAYPAQVVGEAKRPDEIQGLGGSI